MLVDKNIDETEIVDFVVDIAKLNKNYGKATEPNPVDKDKVDRAIKNSKKKVSSASVSGGGGRRTVDEDDLTIEDAKSLSITQWSKLKESTRKRLLMGV